MVDDMDKVIAELRALRPADRRVILASLDPLERLRVKALLNGQERPEESQSLDPFVSWLAQLSPPIHGIVRSSQAAGSARCPVLTVAAANALAQIIMTLPANRPVDPERAQSSQHPSLFDRLWRFLIVGRSR
jgi:hypothetical protein